MTRSRTSLRDSHLGSPDSEDDSSDAKSAGDDKTPVRGRKGVGGEDVMEN